MQTITYKLDITPGGVPLTIHISQYDVGLRQYIFQPYTSVGEFTYVSGTTVTLEATKPDGYAVIHSCEYNQDGSITYTLQEQLAAKAGSVWSKVVIRNGNDVLGTGAVVWMVDNAGVKDNAIISESDIPAIQAAASSASLAQAAATQAAGYVDQAVILGGTPLVAATVSAMSDHDRVYVYTGSETGYTAGNWYYWTGSSWTSGGIYNSSAVQTDPTLSVSGMAADAKATGDGLAKLKNELAEPSRNLNTASVGKYATNNSGTIISSNSSFGMDATIPCLPETTYTASYYDATCSGAPTGWVTYYDNLGGFISRNNQTSLPGAMTVTTPSTAYSMHFSFYRNGGFTIGNNAGIQVELGNEKTAYVLPFQPKGTNAFIQEDININARIDTISDLVSNTPIIINEPGLFTWKGNPLHGKIKTNYSGTYIVDYDVSVNRNADGTVLYVSPSGSDSNNGESPNTPLLSIKKAYNNGANTIVLLPGIHRRANTLYGTAISRSLNIIGDNRDGDVIVCTDSPSTMTILSGYSHVYNASRGTFTGVVDLNNLNSYGDYTSYVNVSSIAEVESTEGSWAHISGVAYVHTINDVTPTEDNGILLLAGAASNPLFYFIGDGSLYMENITCMEGQAPLKATAQTSNSNINVYAKNCRFFYSFDTDGDAVMMQGVKEAIFQNCEASYSKKDGFNYHAAQGIIPKAIEISCIAKANGNSDDSNDQGSTIHDGGSIIRVNCMSFDHYGSNYAEQGTGSESWNINCVCYGSKAETAVQNANFYAYDGVNVFADSCVGFGSLYNINVYESGEIYLRNPRFTGILSPDGVNPIYY